MTVIGEFEAKLYGEDHKFAIVEEGVYEANPMQMRLGVITDDGEPWATLTVCIPHIKLGAGEFLVKTWSENEGIAAAILKAGLFEDTGTRVPSGFVEAQVWRIVDYKSD